MRQAQLERLIRSAEQGSASSRERPLAVLYDELRRLAQRELCRNRSFIMSPTTLRHETCLDSRAAADRGGLGRARFLAYASRAMRGLLIEYRCSPLAFGCNALPGTTTRRHK